MILFNRQYQNKNIIGKIFFTDWGVDHSLNNQYMHITVHLRPKNNYQYLYKICRQINFKNYRFKHNNFQVYNMQQFIALLKYSNDSNFFKLLFTEIFNYNKFSKDKIQDYINSLLY